MMVACYISGCADTRGGSIPYDRPLADRAEHRDPTRTAFDLTAIRRGEAKDPRIYPGDIVVVDGSSIKAAEKQFFRSVPLLAIVRPI